MNGGTDKNPKPDGAGKLVGGYAAGNLTRREEEQLFAAALQDQEIFDALLEEQALKEMLEEPGVRADLIRSLQPKATLWGRVKKWLATPMAWGAAGAFATAAVLLVVVATRAPHGSPGAEMARAPAIQQELPSTPAPAPPPPASPEPANSGASSKRPVEEVAPASAPVLADRQDRGQQQAPAPVQSSQVAELRKETIPGQKAEVRREASSSVAAEQDQLSRPPMAGLAPSEAMQAPLTLDYALLRRNAQGAFEPVTAAFVATTDVLRLQVMPASDGVLSVFHQTGDGIQRTLVSGLRLTRGQVVSVPSQSYIPADARHLTVHFARIAPTQGVGVVGGVPQQAFSQRARAKFTGAVGGAMDVPSKKVMLPAGPVSRTAADSAGANELVLDITIRTN